MGLLRSKLESYGSRFMGLRGRSGDTPADSGEIHRLPVPVGRNLPEKRSSNSELGGLTSGRLIEILGEGSASGQPVSETTALGVGAVVACVQILASMVAKIPIYLYRDTKNGPVEITKHPVLRLLREPSDLHTGFEMRTLMQVGIGLGGNGYARIYRDSYYEPRALEWLAPCDVKPEMVKKPTGERFIKYGIRDAREPLTRSDILHVKSPICLDGIAGIAPIRMLRESLGTSLAQTKAAGSLMRNGTKWPAIMVLSGSPKPDQLKDAREEIQKNLAGSINAGRIPVMGGVDKLIQTNGMSMVDAEFVNSRKLELHEVARHYGVPAFMVDSTATSTWGSGIAQQVRGFLNLSLDAWLCNWEASLAFSLLTGEEKDKGYYFRFDRDQIANVDPKERAEFYKIMREAGAYSPNDIRRKENEPIISSEDGGDSYRTGLPVAALPAPSTTNPTE